MMTQLKIIELYTRNKEFENQLLDGISERGKLIENLRQQILQDAITGKLSEKWRKENQKVESVKVLLGKIVKEKEELIKQKKLKKEKPLKPLQDAEVPFEIPRTWAWCKLGNIGNSNIGLTYNPSNISEKGQPVLRANNIKEGKINTSNVIYVQATVPENKILNKGDIVLCARSGSKDLVGKAAVVEVDGYSFGAFMTCFKSILNPYIYFFFQSNLYKSQIDDRKATGINQLTQDLLRNLLIPIPPLQEQQLIISKLKKIFDNIDKLCEFTKVQNTSVSQIYRTVLKDNFNITFESAA
jgi:type I restriction enzyme S subunit